jgi:DNA-binding GntR family transcriptional regulator
MLGISAAPVREALAILAGRGVVILYPDRGAIVRAMDAEEVCELWEIIAAVGIVGVTEAARAVARGENTEQIVKAYEAVGKDVDTVSPIEFYLRLNAYQYALNTLGGRELVSQAMNQLGVAYWDHYLASFIDVRAELPTYLNTYRRLHEAVMAGDDKGAAGVMRFHSMWSIGKVKAAAAAIPSRRRRRSKNTVQTPV